MDRLDRVYSPQQTLNLLSADQRLADVAPGVLETKLESLRERIKRILDHRHFSAGELRARVRTLSMAARPVDATVFRTLAAVLVERRRLTFGYRARSYPSTTEREVSPQRLTRYRDNWYLDACDHNRNELRCSALDRIESPRCEAGVAQDLAEAELHGRLATAYDLFSGQPTDTAILRFGARRTAWIADETWYLNQQTQWLDDGRLELRISYADPTELILDICRYADEVEVIAPESLRAVAEKLANAAAQYQ